MQALEPQLGEGPLLLLVLPALAQLLLLMEAVRHPTRRDQFPSAAVL